MKKLLALISILSSLPVLGQQDILFSQYMFNPFVINPAYAGTREAVSIVGGVRTQWVGVDGAPNSTSLSIHGPFGKRVGVGFQLFAEEIGPKGSLSYLGTYSYRLPLASGQLSMALRLGGITYQFRWADIDYKDKSDGFNYGTTTQATAFNADFGLMYYTTRFYAGVSANHLASTLRIEQVNNNGAENYLYNHIFATTGYTFEFNETFALQPSVLLRYVEGAPLSADANLNLLISKRIWLGASYRLGNSVVALAQIYFNPKIRLGYSYDMGISQIGKAGQGSHEVFLGLDLNTKKSKVLHPRYF